MPGTMQTALDMEPIEKAKVEGKEKKMVAVVVEALGAHKDQRRRR